MRLRTAFQHLGGLVWVPQFYSAVARPRDCPAPLPITLHLPTSCCRVKHLLISAPRYLETARPWVSHMASLRLSFLVCNTRILIVYLSQLCCVDKRTKIHNQHCAVASTWHTPGVSQVDGDDDDDDDEDDERGGEIFSAVSGMWKVGYYYCCYYSLKTALWCGSLVQSLARSSCSLNIQCLRNEQEGNCTLVSKRSQVRC